MVKHFGSMKPKYKQVLYDAVEKRSINYNGKDIKINPTILLLSEKNELKIPKSEKQDFYLSENFPTSFLDSIDLCFDLTLPNHTKGCESMLNDISSIHFLSEIFEETFFEKTSQRIVLKSNEALGSKEAGYQSPEMNLS